MFTLRARAFVSRQPFFARQWILSARHMANDTSETTIVDICREKIQKALDADSVKVTGAYDDPNGSHISILVISSRFEGKRPVQRQQLVYKAIWEELQGPVHAVDEMICKTPNE
jgi:acid stress-induced BolA-like protein IbaG/YrbA